MIVFRAALALTLAMAAFAATPALADAANTQQTLMKTCNADAGTQHLAGTDRKAFLSSCLAGKTAAPATVAPAAAPMTPQERMKSCNAQAGDQKLAGDPRKSFMSTCLKAG